MTNQVNHQQEDGRLDDGRMRLAVIDDEDRWLGVFKRMFRDTSYQLETFSDPRNFLSVIGNEPKRFAGIICDIKMPEIDGHQVFKEIKENPETANIPFVMVSGMLTENLNLNRVQGIAHVSKLDDNLRTRIFDELIEIIENWPFLETFLQEKQVDPEDIKFFHQFYVNYHLFFGQILDFVRRMEIACVNFDAKEAIRVRTNCQSYLEDLQRRSMDLVYLAQDCQQAQHFVTKVCSRARNSLNMLIHFQVLLGESAPADSDFPRLLTECRECLEKIVDGSEKGYRLRE